MLSKGFEIASALFTFIGWCLLPVFVGIIIFISCCVVWYFEFVYLHHIKPQPSGQVPQKKRPLFKQLFVDLPRRYVLDYLSRETDFFYPKGIHMFCGEQGSGKTIAAVEMMTRLHRQYPASKMITNFGVTEEDDSLDQWQQLLDYTNGHKGVIVGIDEIQNWFMSGLNKLPEGMLEVATQNRKNCRILCCTAQVFTRVNKGLREQVTLVYNPHTVLGCFTIVIKRKPVFDSEGNVLELKYRGMYCFVHSDELRASYDTYKVIHTLSKEGFKDPPVQQNVSVYVPAAGNRKKR